MLAQNYSIYYLDEVLFSSKATFDWAWSPLRDNFKIDKKQMSMIPQAVVATISADRGVVYFELYEKSVNIKKFQQYLQHLRNRCQGMKICLFLDQLSSHSSPKSRLNMSQLGFKYIFNAAYSPQFNPIEYIFAKIKLHYKKEKLRRITNGMDIDVKEMIKQSFKNITKKDCINCINKSC